MLVGQMQELKTQEVLENASLFCAEHSDITHPCCCYTVSRLLLLSLFYLVLMSRINHLC